MKRSQIALFVLMAVLASIAMRYFLLRNSDHGEMAAVGLLTSFFAAFAVLWRKR